MTKNQKFIIQFIMVIVGGGYTMGSLIGNDSASISASIWLVGSLLYGKD